MSKILLLTPPFVQPNTPYPATAYLKGWLSRKGVEAVQADLSVELLGEIFSRQFLTDIFAEPYSGDDANCQRIYSLRKEYIATIDLVMAFLRGEDRALANLICAPDWLPQAGRFEQMVDPSEVFGAMGLQDCAEYLSTLYLQDLSDYLREVITPNFEIVRYGEQISASVVEFSTIEQELQKPLNAIENRMCALLRAKIEEHKPDWVGFTVPFPGNLLSTLRCGEYLKTNFPHIKTVMGGGYPTTELRNMTDKEIFRYIDYIVLDDGEEALLRLIEGREPIRTYSAEGYHEGDDTTLTHLERGCPDFGGLDMSRYFSLCEVTNPMHRLWSDGRWNKMILAHGCYWAKCAFCDTTLDYICRFEQVSAAQTVDWMEQVAQQTGSRSFHFVDEAASPKILKELSLELLRRGHRYTWWTNIRFEKAFTGDLCALMAKAGCIAVSGGLEAAHDRLLAMVDKGIDIEQATIVMRNFYYSGIMVHTYLMYGLPTETLAETIDALETVRQMFKAELIGSAFWHRYAMTLHSRSGASPEEFGVRRKGTVLNPFANNEISFAENRGYNIEEVGEGLRLSLANYLVGSGLDKPVGKWFNIKVPQPTVEPTLITDHLIKPDSSRIYSDKARIVWIGADAVVCDKGVAIEGPSGRKEIKFNPEDREFIVEVIRRCANLDQVTRLEDIKALYAESHEEPFVVLYHSKSWDKVRALGLLQL